MPRKPLVFTVDETWFVKIYKFSYRTISRKPNSFLCRVQWRIFREFAFLLVRAKVKLLGRARLNGKDFFYRSTNSQYHSIYFEEYREGYEPEITAVSEPFLTEGNLFLDVGANWGYHSIRASVGCGANVLAFEPNPLVYDDLTQVVEGLGLSNKIKTFNCGVSDFQGELDLFCGGFESGNASIFQNRKSDDFGFIQSFRDLRFSVPLVRLDDVLIDSQGIVLKVDVEGAELSVLRGAEDLIKSFRPLIIFELWFEGGKSEIEPYKSLLPSSYQIFEIQWVEEKLKISHCPSKGVFGRKNLAAMSTLHLEYFESLGLLPN